MAVIGTFGSYTAARLGIYASQASLSATGNNIANINTPGYTRQRMDLVSLYNYGAARYSNSYQQNIGYGVLTSGVSQLRDPFLDIRYREENASVGAYDEKLDCLQQLAAILDEVGKGTDDFGIIEAEFSDLLGQLQKLLLNTGDVVNDSTVRGSAQTLTNLLNNYSKAMETLAANKLNELKEDVKTVNALLTQIRDLNVQIRDAGIVGDNALELRDARNLCIDQLSAYMKIDVTYDMEKIDEFNSVERITISIADSGNPPILLVQGVYGGQISLDEMTAARNPEFKANNVKETDPKEFIKSIGIRPVKNADGSVTFEPYIEYTNSPREAMKFTDENGDPILDDNGNPKLVRNDKEGFNEALDALRNDLKRQMDNEVEKVQAKVKEALEQKAKLENRNTTLNNDKANAETAKADWEAKQKDALAAKATAEANVKKFSDELDELQEQLKNLGTEDGDGSVTEEDLKKKIADKKKELSDARGALDKAESDYKDAQREMNKLDREIESLTKKLTANQKEVGDINDRLAAMIEKEYGVQRDFTSKSIEDIEDINDDLKDIIGVKYGDARDELDKKSKATDGLLGNEFFDPENANAPYVKYLLDEDGNPVLDENGNMTVVGYTWDAEGATKVDNAVEGSKKNRLWMRVEPLRDIKGRYLRNAEHQELKDPVDLTDNQLYGSLQSLREFLTEKGEFSSKDDVKFDPAAGQKRGIQYYQNSLDALARKFAEAFNKANQLNISDVSAAYQLNDAGNAFIGKDGQPIVLKDSNGNEIGPDFFDKLGAKMDKLEALQKQVASGRLSEEDIKDKEKRLEELKAEIQGETDETKKEELEAEKTKLEEQLKTGKLSADEIAKKSGEIKTLKEEVDKEVPNAYKNLEILREKGALTEKWSFYNGGVLFSNNGNGNDTTNITAGNITISDAWTTGSVRILNTKVADGLDHSTANDNILHMISMMSQDMDYYPSEIVDNAKTAGTRYFTGSFQERLADMSSILGVETNTTILLYNSYTATALSLENSRQSVAGVDLNDEATNMMVYQKAYAAACQLMTTLDSMLDKLINGTLR